MTACEIIKKNVNNQPIKWRLVFVFQWSAQCTGKHSIQRDTTSQTPLSGIYLIHFDFTNSIKFVMANDFSTDCL